jgi:hypothetical protein
MSARDSDPSAWAFRGPRDEADRLALAEAARIEAEEAQKRAEAIREAAQTTAMRMAAERDEAIAKASELEEELAAARDQVVEQPAVEPEPTAQGDIVAEEPAPAPAAPESIRFAPRGHRPVLTIGLALGSLAAAGWAVYLAVGDRLTSGAGLLAVATTVVLAVTVGRMGRDVTTVSIERGIVQVVSGKTTERADLTSTATLVELIGRPGERDRKVMLVRKTRGPLSVVGSMVDLDAFVEALRHWRPAL